MRQTGLAISKTFENGKVFTRLEKDHVDQAKRAYTTSRIDFSAISGMISGDISPSAGDLLLARIVEIGHHTRIELPEGRRAYLHVGDEVILCYGNRYAPDQFEAYVPADLGPCQMVAAGGIAAKLMSSHQRMKVPTSLAPIGILAGQDGKPVNLSDWALPNRKITHPIPPVYAVVGSSMNSGKTTCAATMVKGLSREGFRVGAAKITGTGAGGDRWKLRDAGALHVLDFTDVGLSSTFRESPEKIITIFESLVGHLSESETDVIILEIADGLLQQETADLLRSKTFQRFCNGLVFAASDALGAARGVTTLADWGLNILGVSGQLTSSPLATQEAQTLLSVPVIETSNLSLNSWLPLGKSDEAKPGWRDNNFPDQIKEAENVCQALSSKSCNGKTRNIQCLKTPENCHIR